MDCSSSTIRSEKVSMKLPKCITQGMRSLHEGFWGRLYHKYPDYRFVLYQSIFHITEVAKPIQLLQVCFYLHLATSYVLIGVMGTSNN